MNLRTKLLLALLPLAIALAAIGLLAISTIGKLGSHSQTILKDNYRSVLAAQRMKESSERMDSAALFLIAGHKKEGADLAARNRKTFEKELQVEEGNITEAGEDEAARQLRAQWDLYQKQYDHFSALADAESARVFYFRSLYPLFSGVKQLADNVLGMNQDAMVYKSDRVRRLAERMNTFMAIATLIAALAGAALSFALARRMLRPLSVLSQTAHRIGEGDLSVRAQVAGHDEIARLADEFNIMAGHLDQYRRSSLGELVQAQQTAQAAIDSLPDPVLVFGLEGNLLNVNAAGERLLVLSTSGEGADPLAGLAPELKTALERIRGHVLEGKEPYTPKSFDEAIRVPSSGGDRWFLPRANPLYGSTEGILGVTMIVQDVTRLRRFDALEADRVSAAAQELQPPLTSLHTAIHLCLDESVGTFNDKQSDLLYAARQECERLQSIADDLLRRNPEG